MNGRILFLAAVVLAVVPVLAGFLAEPGRRADLIGELSEMLAITMVLSAAVLLGLEKPAGAPLARRAANATLVSIACGAIAIVPAIVVAPPTPAWVWAVRVPHFFLIVAAVALVVYLITRSVVASKLAKRSHS